MTDTTMAVALPVTPIKQGHVSVRGHFMWRVRFVVVEHGRVTIQRSGRGAVKAKIDLLDASVRVVFHEDSTQIAIQSFGHSTILNCLSTRDRDEWVGALFTAKGGHCGDTDCESSDLAMSSMDEFEKELSTRHAAETAPDHHRDRQSFEDETGSDQEYNDTMLAFQDLRSSLMQVQRSLIDNEDEEIVDDHGRLSILPELRSHSDEDISRQRNLHAIVSFIHATQHGGRAVLLHLDVIASECGISLEDILCAMSDKQRQTTTASAAAGLQKLHVATFVRYILFHPVYSKQPEVQSRRAAVDALVDRHFPHCRLRRFSHDIEQGGSVHAFELDVPSKDSDSGSVSQLPRGARIAPLATSGGKPDLEILKRKRHSFPNILLPLQIGPLAVQPSLARIDSMSTPLTAKRSTSENLAEHAESGSEQNNSDLFYDELLPEPLRNVLWKFSCQQVAEQLSVFHQHQLAALTLWAFLDSPKHEAKPLTDHFNRLVSYFVWSVLVEDTAKDRAEVIESIVSIATAASTAPLHNYHLVMACVGCLGDTPLMPSRLPVTWKRVRSKFKTQLVTLRTLCDHTGGFETLRKRQATESAKGSCTPFIGVIGVTLERLRLIPYVPTSVGLLDLDKIDRQYVALSAIENTMLRPYKIHEIDELQQWIHTKMTAMDAFVSPRLLQLRSQQLLASESTQQTGSRQLSLYRSRNSPPNSSGNGSSSSDTTTDSGPPLLPFREICSLLVSTHDVVERIHVAIEALLVDDQQPLAQRVRKFHHEFKQSACHSACHVMLASVRHCVEALMRDVITHKSFELMQLTGLDDTSIELERGVYVALHQAVTQPIATWLFTKVRHAFAEEDTRLSLLLGPFRPRKSSDESRTRARSVEKPGHSPLDLLYLLADAFADLPLENDATVRVQRCREVLSTWTTAPFSVLCLLQQSLDALFLPRDLREPLELLDSALSTLGAKRPSSRALQCMGNSSKCLPLETDVLK